MKQKVLYELGVEALSNSQADRAVGYLRQAVDMTGGDRRLRAQASLWLGDALYDCERYADAARAYEAAIDGKIKENLPLAYYGLAYSQYKREEYKAAAANFARAAANVTAQSGASSSLAAMKQDATLRQADCLYYTGQYAEAGRLYDRAQAEGGPEADYALYRHAVMMGLAGKLDKKTDELAQLERLYPESRWLAPALQELALTYEEQGRKTDAADAYKRRLDALGGNVDMDELLRMADSMREAGRSEDLLDVIARIHRAGSLSADEAADIDLYEADALSDLGRYGEAEPIYANLAANTSSLPGSKAAVMLAENLLKQRDFDAARQAMEEFTEAGTPHEYWLARAYIALADAYHGLGQTSLGREYLVSLRENYPGDEPEIAQMIDSRLKSWKQ